MARAELKLCGYVDDAFCDGDLRCAEDLALRAAAAAGGFGAGDAAAFALGDEVTALLDLAQDAVALDSLAEAREQMLGGFAVSKVY